MLYFRGGLLFSTIVHQSKKIVQFGYKSDQANKVKFLKKRISIQLILLFFVFQYN